MQSDDFSSLYVSRYELRLLARRDADLPAFLGSTLRGAFGHALKEAVCVMSHRDCARCMLADRCVYPYLFETPVPPDVPQLRGQQQAPHPFILMSPVLLPSDRRQQVAAGQELTFGLLLMGRAIDYLPYVVYAVSEMARRGLGVNRARFELASVAAIDERDARTTIYSGESERLAVSGSMTTKLSDLVRTRLEGILERKQAQAEAAATTGSLKLRFMTPTRIRVEGDLQTSMSFELLARNLLRRVSLLAAVHGREKMSLDYRGLIADAAGVETRSVRLEWDDWERYSNRQQAKMKLGGFVGEVEYTGEAIEGYLPLLVAGEILHVGAATSFGLGKYEIVA